MVPHLWGEWFGGWAEFSRLCPHENLSKFSLLVQNSFWWRKCNDIALTGKMRLDFRDTTIWPFGPISRSDINIDVMTNNQFLHIYFSLPLWHIWRLKRPEKEDNNVEMNISFTFWASFIYRPIPMFVLIYRTSLLSIISGNINVDIGSAPSGQSFTFTQQANETQIHLFCHCVIGADGFGNFPFVRQFASMDRWYQNAY